MKDGLYVRRSDLDRQTARSFLIEAAFLLDQQPTPDVVATILIDIGRALQLVAKLDHDQTGLAAAEAMLRGARKGEEKMLELDEVPKEEPMTEKQIYEALGLQPPDVFALSRLRYNVSAERHAELGTKATVENVARGTGRTTRTLVQALVLALQGSAVHIVVLTQKRAMELNFELQRMAGRLARKKDVLSRIAVVASHRIADRPELFRASVSLYEHDVG